MSLDRYLPSHVNRGPWITAWTLFRLRELSRDVRFVLPVCSLRHSYEDLVSDESIHLPPLFVEAMSPSLEQRLADRILACFPEYSALSNSQRVEIVRHAPDASPTNSGPSKAKVLAFSVDTAVEEHGPHLPLGTDTIQSYSVLQKLADSIDGFQVAKPLEYGQLTWGLPFGFSVDITADLLTEYVTGYVNALLQAEQPESIYVVDVHGSITHRQAIVEGLKRSECQRWAFRWLHEPLAEFASDRGDQHAGGVETALVEFANTNLVDHSWFPSREAEIVAGQMTLEKAVELTPDLDGFTNYVNTHQCNGIVGSVTNYHSLDATKMFDRMLSLAVSDVEALLAGDSGEGQQAGQSFW